MRLRTYYTWAILIPVAVLAAVAAAGGDDASSTIGLGPGATVRWLPLVVVLAIGLVREMVAEQGGCIALRLLVRAVVGYGYVGLVEWVRQQLTLHDLRGRLN